MKKDFKKRFYHAGIYIGNNNICHITKKINGVRITDFDDFLKDTTGKIIKIHPIIPFKTINKIAQQIIGSEKIFEKINIV